MKKVKNFVAKYKGKFGNKDLNKDLPKIIKLLFKRPNIFSINGDRYQLNTIKINSTIYVYSSGDKRDKDLVLLHKMRDEITRTVILPKRKQIYLEIAEKFLNGENKFGFCKEFGNYITNSYCPQFVISVFPEFGLFIGKSSKVIRNGSKDTDYITDDGKITNYGNFSNLLYNNEGSEVRGMIALFCAEMCDENLEILK